MTRSASGEPTPPRPSPSPSAVAASCSPPPSVSSSWSPPGCVANAAPPDTGPDPTPPTTPDPGPSDPPKEDPQSEPAPAPEPEGVEVPTLVGMTRAEAEQIVADLGLEATTKYKSTDQYPAEIVISPPKAGARVLPDSTISLVVAKTPAPEPPPHRRPRSRAAIRPIPTCVLTLRSRTMTVRAARATDPGTLRVRSACSHPTRSIWTARATAWAARTGNRCSSAAIN